MVAVLHGVLPLRGLSGRHAVIGVGRWAPRRAARLRRLVLTLDLVWILGRPAAVPRGLRLSPAAVEDDGDRVSWHARFGVRLHLAGLGPGHEAREKGGVLACRFDRLDLAEDGDEIGCAQVPVCEHLLVVVVAALAPD